MKAPVIGIPLDSEDGGGYSKLPWYALRKNYVESVVKAGGVPLLLPHEEACTEAYINMIDGLLIAGGAFDIDPALFGADHRHETVTLKPGRTLFEASITRAALAADKPVLGICGGQQLLHVLLGGTLIQHIPDEIPSPLAHEQPNPRTEPGHVVHVREGTLLHRITGEQEFPVNSAHHQAAKTPGPGVVVSATAPDGVVEAIEHPSYSFCLGVQWHPEYHISPADKKIFDAFINEARLP
ncbi:MULTISPECIES: gamma-glutamyl-gamma-aminobutyrate hydrolase family protein [unclassified Haematospirillum]|uniref:gamma-glutamyl-gamma-aminobutyrate hydrolase family protein n=1 Tax=unclassified Haematospirillum TaxID=2622088 RepID=UPI00143AF3AF|nr:MULTISPECIES: gamma-glutamyl-gamma-aminobutyrate hydrolase family protein [unclassified Haematospirillum]NKD54619.1 gamma-glutamyl-gamma-aminobutyrate hydrolase family protein [Haematospirillum sp. H4890]NKD74769.1 gamma-glutamyl-gamma-aminobutyrate hydrolase family protein [Haematospirillum sp. H4485]NKD87980.1 gamma-glutamyl-gamma-aminobutyrate hydrolase family protein [Haematospirillum sp. 15-248]